MPLFGWKFGLGDTVIDKDGNKGTVVQHGREGYVHINVDGKRKKVFGGTLKKEKGKKPK